VAIEIKGTDHVQSKHLKGLHAFAEEYTAKRLIIVSLEPVARRVGAVQILPWELFLQKLWGGEIF
jgi:hypothetical protein